MPANMTDAVFGGDKFVLQFSWGVSEGGTIPRLSKIKTELESLHYSPKISALQFETQVNLLIFNLELPTLNMGNKSGRVTSFRILAEDCRSAIAATTTADVTLLDIEREFTKWGKLPDGSTDPNTSGPGIIGAIRESMGYTASAIANFAKNNLGMNFDHLAVVAILGILGLILAIYAVRRFT